MPVFCRSFRACSTAASSAAIWSIIWTTCSGVGPRRDRLTVLPVGPDTIFCCPRVNTLRGELDDLPETRPFFPRYAEVRDGVVVGGNSPPANGVKLVGIVFRHAKFYPVRRRRIVRPISAARPAGAPARSSRPRIPGTARRLFPVGTGVVVSGRPGVGPRTSSTGERVK